MNMGGSTRLLRDRRCLFSVSLVWMVLRSACVMFGTLLSHTLTIALFASCQRGGQPQRISLLSTEGKVHQTITSCLCRMNSLYVRWMLSRKVWLKSGEDNDADDGLKVSSCINAALSCLMRLPHCMHARACRMVWI